MENSAFVREHGLELHRNPEQASLALICKRLRLSFKKLSEKKVVEKVVERSDLLKNPTPQCGRKNEEVQL